MSKYKVKVKDGDKEVEQEVDIDTEKETETIRIPKTDSSNAGEVDIVYDFKRVRSACKSDHWWSLHTAEWVFRLVFL